MSVGVWFFRWSWQEIRDGELLSVILSLMLIVGSVFAMSSIVDRFDRFVMMQGRSMLTADLAFESAHPLPQTLQERSDRSSLTFTDQLQFRTMAFSDEAMELVKVKAVYEAYPLLGTLRLKTAGGDYLSSVSPGELWLSERLLSLMKVKVGDVITLGDAEMVISGVIAQDPQLSLNPFNQIPTAYIHQSSVFDTGAAQVGGRLKYYRYFVGPEKEIDTLKASTSLLPGQRWVSDWSADQADSMMFRARQYFALTVVLIVVMAAITLFLTGRYYAASRVRQVGTIKALGGSRRWLLRRFATQTLILFSIGFLGGLLGGLILEQLLLMLLQPLLPGVLPGIGAAPFTVACLIAMVVILPCLGIPMMALLGMPASATLSGSAELLLNRRNWVLILPAILLLVVWVGDNTLVWFCLLGLLGTFGVLLALGILFIGLSRVVKIRSFALSLAIKRMRSRPARTGVQLAAFTTTLLLVSLMWLIQSDLLNDWQQTLPADAPNVFAVNIAPDEKETFLEALDVASFERSSVYPVVRGRLIEINGAIAQGDLPESQRERALRRELNFTFASELPDHNDIVDGKWARRNSVSVESGLADRLGIAVGDNLTFVVNSQSFEAQVTSLRDVPWRSMKPNFYFIFSPDVLHELPATWKLSFKVNQGQELTLNDLSKAFPTISLLDLRVLTERALSILQQLAKALTLLAGVGVVAGLALVSTMLRLSLNERMHEARIYRVLGASRLQIRNTLLSEFGLMGGVCGLLSVAAAEFVMAAIAHWVFEMPVTFHGWLWLVLPALAVASVMVIVAFSLKEITSVSAVGVR